MRQDHSPEFVYVLAVGHLALPKPLSFLATGQLTSQDNSEFTACQMR